MKLSLITSAAIAAIAISTLSCASAETLDPDPNHGGECGYGSTICPPKAPSPCCWYGWACTNNGCENQGDPWGRRRHRRQAHPRRGARPMNPVDPTPCLIDESIPDEELDAEEEDLPVVTEIDVRALRDTEGPWVSIVIRADDEGPRALCAHMKPLEAQTLAQSILAALARTRDFKGRGEDEQVTLRLG